MSPFASPDSTIPPFSDGVKSKNGRSVRGISYDNTGSSWEERRTRHVRRADAACARASDELRAAVDETAPAVLAAEGV